MAGRSSNQEVHQAPVSSEGHSCAGGNESGTAAAVWVAWFHNHASRTQKINKLKSRKIPIIPSHLIHTTLRSARNFKLICPTLYGSQLNSYNTFKFTLLTLVRPNPSILARNSTWCWRALTNTVGKGNSILIQPSECSDPGQSPGKIGPTLPGQLGTGAVTQAASTCLPGRAVLGEQDHMTWLQSKCAQQGQLWTKNLNFVFYVSFKGSSFLHRSTVKTSQGWDWTSGFGLYSLQWGLKTHKHYSPWHTPCTWCKVSGFEKYKGWQYSGPQPYLLIPPNGTKTYWSGAEIPSWMARQSMRNTY